LAEKLHRESGEERLWKELWDVADEEEKKARARLMVKWSSKSA